LSKLLSERHRLAFDVVRSKEITQKPLRDAVRGEQLKTAADLVWYLGLIYLSPKNNS
jgi:P-protein